MVSPISILLGNPVSTNLGGRLLQCVPTIPPPNPYPKELFITFLFVSGSLLAYCKSKVYIVHVSKQKIVFWGTGSSKILFFLSLLSKNLNRSSSDLIVHLVPYIQNYFLI